MKRGEQISSFTHSVSCAWHSVTYICCLLILIWSKEAIVLMATVATIVRTAGRTRERKNGGNFEHIINC